MNLTKKKVTDKDRLNALIQIRERGSIDFDQMLFFARQKRKTEEGAYKLALTEYIERGYL